MLHYIDGDWNAQQLGEDSGDYKGGDAEHSNDEA